MKWEEVGRAVGRKELSVLVGILRTENEMEKERTVDETKATEGSSRERLTG